MYISTYPLLNSTPGEETTDMDQSETSPSELKTTAMDHLTHLNAAIFVSSVSSWSAQVQNFIIKIDITEQNGYKQGSG